MSTLTNQQINLTYFGLIKTNDNLAIDATPKFLEDGVGNTVPMKIGTTEIQFTDTVDFSAATVTGLAAGGLVAGTGPDSMKSADFLTTTPATSSNQASIGIGNNANASGYGGTAIGDNSSATNNFGTGLGRQAQATGSGSVAVGNDAQASNQNAIAMGYSARGIGTDAVAIGSGGSAGGSFGGIKIGKNNVCSSDALISIGNSGNTGGFLSIGIGYQANTTGSQNITIQTTGYGFGNITGTSNLNLVPGGYSGSISTNRVIVIGTCVDSRERAQGDDAISIGSNSQASNVGSIAIGLDSSTLANNAVALGAGIQATIADTVSVAELETKTVGGGITMYSPNGTAYKLTISDAGALVIS